MEHPRRRPPRLQYTLRQGISAAVHLALPDKQYLDGPDVHAVRHDDERRDANRPASAVARAGFLEAGNGAGCGQAEGTGDVLGDL